ncbi:Retrovirus-related Pol polyprotein from transposon 17.6 [Trichinella nelsoni]|uniref:Retrovirus-related Pol polyprotein from transposon 17.6 n=1 Tax=Trichinella nelsoni TaxID=6336 RepID=A0A0V0RUL5_9BILA|nr:Retrovirus-related Pol polyprotein from transposon 17.6 [Trichinella nelsoni]
MKDNCLANIAAPLQRLLEKGAEWDWLKACQSAFDALNYHLTSAPILVHPDFHRQFTVDVDASGDGLGAVLSQREGKRERVLAYASRTLTKAKRLRDSERNAQFGVGLARALTITLWPAIPDHNCLRLLKNLKEPEGQVDRWLESLAELDFELQHRMRAAPRGPSDVDQKFTSQLLAVQQADPEIQLMWKWLGGASRPVECPLECSRDMHCCSISGAEDGLICRYRRRFMAEEGAKQVLVTQALRSEVMQSMLDMSEQTTDKTSERLTSVGEP